MPLVPDIRMYLFAYYTIWWRIEQDFMSLFSLNYSTLARWIKTSDSVRVKFVDGYVTVLE